MKSGGTIIVAGDCQALEIAAAANRLDALADRFDFVHLTSGAFGEARNEPTASEAETCVALWRQNTDASPESVDMLGPAVPRLTFPTTGLGIYLPFQVFDPFRPGRTWHGDRVLMALEEEGLPLDEVAEAYHERSRRDLPSPYKMRVATLRLLQWQEEGCTVQPSGFLAAEMFRRRLFWDMDHAAPPMIGWLLGELIRRTPGADTRLRTLAEEMSAGVLRVDDLYPWHVPIPKATRDYLDLRWVSDDQRYTYDGVTRTEDDYLRWYAQTRRLERTAAAGRD